MQTTDVEILKGLISLIKVNNGKFSDDDIKLLKGIYQIINSYTEPERWITVKGNHIPIFAGETSTQAIKKFFLNKKQSQTIPRIKQGKPMSLEKAIAGTNPNYKHSYGYRNNCQSCIAVFEARLRGYNIEALPFDKNIMEELEYMPNLAFIDKKTNQPPKIKFLGIENAGDCYRWLDKHIKKGERYAFGYAPTMTSAHIIVVTKTAKGNLVFYDPQKSLIKNPTFLNNMVYRSWNINGRIEKLPIAFRIDNTELNKEWINKISKPSN